MDLSGISALLGIFEFLLPGSPILLTVMFVPMAIYDRKNGVYRGFFHPLGLFWLAVAGFAGWRMAEEAVSPNFEPWVSVVIMILFTVAGSRLVVEELHKHLHGEWLHKQGVWLLKKSVKP